MSIDVTVRREVRQDELASTWEEIGLAQFPVVTTSLKRPPFDTVTFVERVGKDAQGQPINRSWKMIGSKEYGLPRLPDLDVFIAILKLLERHGYQKKLVSCTANEICEIAGIARGGKTYERIRGAMVRFQTTSYVAENHFIDPKTGDRVVSEGWDIITDHRIVADHRGQRPTDGLPSSYFAVSTPFLNRLQQGKLKPLDLALWRELPLGLEKPMFHYLDKNLYQKSQYEVGLRRFSERIGLTGTYDMAQLKRLCSKPLETLIGKQFLKEFRFEQSKMPQDPWKLVVVPGPRARGSFRIGVRYPSAPKRAPEGRTVRNSGHPEVDRAVANATQHPRPASPNRWTLADAYQAWCRTEAERRLEALGTEERNRRITEALVELQKGRHGETFRTSPDYFRTRLAENRVRRSITKSLPSFDEWKEGSASGSLTDQAA